MERITLNLIPKGITPICHASQYDTGRQIALDLMDDLQGYTLSDETIELGVCKPDGNIVTAAVEVTSGKTYVTIETTEQMTACEGDSECELKISKDGAVIGTLNFKLRVERDPLKDGIESDTEIHNLTNQIHDINEEMIPAMVAEEVENQYDSQNVIFDDHPTAGHGTGYVVKSENVPDELADLNDIDIDNPQANQALVYNPDTGKFENGEVSTVGSINDLDDVNTTGAAEGTSLVAKEENGEIVWKPKKTIIELTAAEYAALKAGGNLQPDTEYLLKDAPALIPTAEDIEYEAGSGDTVKDKIDELDTDKVNISDLPLWVKQTSGQSLTLQIPFTFFYYYADQWNAHIPLPFISKNSNYSVTLTEVIAENIGNITAKCSVQSKTATFFDIQTTRTMTALPDTFSTCVGRCKFTITFT